MSNIPIFSVTELSQSIKNSLEKKYERLRVKGEITGYKNWNGHLLFNLKDENSLLLCRVWMNKVRFLDIIPEDGFEVICIGKISTHMQRSNYNFIVENIKLEGEGALLKVVENRKAKFIKLGYFDENIKKPLPFLPKKIGIITSLSGAVIEDIKKTILERFPSHLLIWPVSVQGQKSEIEISQAIKGLNKLKYKPDVIILARGGGSIEDLMPFNSEALIKAIYDSTIPVVSAIGHETDYTLCDFVADKRASTPTYAADLVVPEQKNLIERLAYLLGRMKDNVTNNIKKNTIRYEAAKKRIIHPRKALEISKKKKEDYFFQIERFFQNIISNYSNILDRANLNNPKKIIESKKELYTSICINYDKLIFRFLYLKKNSLDNLSKRLESLSYQRLLEKGFVVLKKDNKEIIKNIRQINVNDSISIQFSKGIASAKIKKIQK